MDRREGRCGPTGAHGRWDIAAGGLLAREAGGRAASTEGDEEFLATGTLAVSNGLVRDPILRVLHEGDAAPLPQ